VNFKGVYGVFKRGKEQAQRKTKTFFSSFLQYILVDTNHYKHSCIQKGRLKSRLKIIIVLWRNSCNYFKNLYDNTHQIISCKIIW